jgi:hypothetical protein
MPIQPATVSRSGLAPSGTPPGCRSMKLSIDDRRLDRVERGEGPGANELALLRVAGSSAGERSAMCRTIAPDSNSVSSPSSSAGTWPNGCRAR